MARPAGKVDGHIPGRLGHLSSRPTPLPSKESALKSLHKRVEKQEASGTKSSPILDSLRQAKGLFKATTAFKGTTSTDASEFQAKHSEALKSLHDESLADGSAKIKGAFGKVHDKPEEEPSPAMSPVKSVFAQLGDQLEKDAAIPSRSSMDNWTSSGLKSSPSVDAEKLKRGESAAAVPSNILGQAAQHGHTSVQQSAAFNALLANYSVNGSRVLDQSLDVYEARCAAPIGRQGRVHSERMKTRMKRGRKPLEVEFPEHVLRKQEKLDKEGDGKNKIQAGSDGPSPRRAQSDLLDPDLEGMDHFVPHKWASSVGSPSNKSKAQDSYSAIEAWKQQHRAMQNMDSMHPDVAEAAAKLGASIQETARRTRPTRRLEPHVSSPEKKRVKKLDDEGTKKVVKNPWERHELNGPEEVAKKGLSAPDDICGLKKYNSIDSHSNHLQALVAFTRGAEDHMEPLPDIITPISALPKCFKPEASVLSSFQELPMSIPIPQRYGEHSLTECLPPAEQREVVHRLQRQRDAARERQSIVAQASRRQEILKRVASRRLSLQLLKQAEKPEGEEEQEKEEEKSKEPEKDSKDVTKFAALKVLAHMNQKAKLSSDKPQTIADRILGRNQEPKAVRRASITKIFTAKLLGNEAEADEDDTSSLENLNWMKRLDERAAQVVRGHENPQEGPEGDAAKRAADLQAQSDDEVLAGKPDNEGDMLTLMWPKQDIMRDGPRGRTGRRESAAQLTRNLRQQDLQRRTQEENARRQAENKAQGPAEGGETVEAQEDKESVASLSHDGSKGSKCSAQTPPWMMSTCRMAKSTLDWLEHDGYVCKPQDIWSHSDARSLRDKSRLAAAYAANPRIYGSQKATSFRSRLASIESEACIPWPMSARVPSPARARSEGPRSARSGRSESPSIHSASSLGYAGARSPSVRGMYSPHRR